MDSSILQTIKKLRGIDSSYTHFDTDIIVFINTALAQLTQIGVGPDQGFLVEGQSQTWGQFIGCDDKVLLGFVKTFVDKRTCQMFDPPSSGTVAQANNRILEELTFRIYVRIHNKKVVSEDE